MLGVPAGATQAQLKAAHRALVRVHHPDVADPADRAAATRRVQEINVAYGMVRDPQRRAEYDRAVRSGRAADMDAVVLAAGRWAGRWWARHRVRLQRSALQVRSTAQGARATVRRGTGVGKRIAYGLAGRVLWLLLCVLGALTGWIVVVLAQRWTGTNGYVAPLVATIGGLAVGNQRGWGLRLRLAGVRPPPMLGRLVLGAWAIAVTLSLWIDARLA